MIDIDLIFQRAISTMSDKQLKQAIPDHLKPFLGEGRNVGAASVHVDTLLWCKCTKCFVHLQTIEW